MRVPRRRRQALMWQSWLLRAQGDPAAATEKLQTAVRELGDDPEPLREWCQLMFELGNLPAAEEGLRGLVQRNPIDAAAHHNLGTVYLRAERFAEAETECRLSLELRPRFAPTAAHLAFALENLGQIRQAIQTWRDVLTIEPGNPQALESLARCESLANTLRLSHSQGADGSRLENS